MARTWGDDIFGGFKKLTDEEIKGRRDEDVMRNVGYILHNYHISLPELVEIIEANAKDPTP